MSEPDRPDAGVLTDGGLSLPELAHWPHARDRIPDVRDGLTRVERVVLWQLDALERELGGRAVPTALLYGRVVDHGVQLRPHELTALLGRLGARTRLA